MSLLMTFQLGFAQKTVSGTVTDTSGVPLPGATVVVQGTNNGVTTNFDGDYSISASEGDVLVVSFVGFESASATVGAASTYDFSLSEGNALEEVVVTALGISREKKSLGYWLKKAIVSKNVYEKKYSQSLKDNDGFWRKEGKRVTWIKPYSKIKDVKYSSSDVNIKWFYDGTLNASANCIDRHLKNNKDKTAIMWVGDDPKVQKKITYKQLHNEVCKIANGLKEIGVQKGDTRCAVALNRYIIY